VELLTSQGYVKRYQRPIAVPTLQPAKESADGDTIGAGADLHPRLRAQLGPRAYAGFRRSAERPAAAHQSTIREIDERRGIVLDATAG
jgi:hypothetical protein